MKKFLILVIILFNANLVIAQTPELLFKSGFDSSTKITYTGLYPPWNISGTDASTSNNWVTTIYAIDNVEKTYGNVENPWGTYSLAEIVADPENANNKVLHFIAYDMPWKGSYYNSARISWSLIYKSTGTLFTEGYTKYRMRFSAGFGALANVSNAIDWLIISEIFEHNSALTPNDETYSLNLSIHKDWGNGQKIYWSVGSRYKDANYNWVYDYTTGHGPSAWSATNKTVSVPIETWFTLEMYFKKGDATHGRYYVAITPDGGSKQCLFDITGYTYSTLDSVNTVTDWSMLKLYTDMAHAMASTPLGIWYDDFEYWNTIPVTAPGTVPGSPNNLIIN
jgi:hypothetical protein